MDTRTALRRIWLSVVFLCITSMVGILGFMLLEGYALIDAIYMTAITMSTVGFGTIRELSDNGKLFAVFLIIISAGTFVYAITNISTFIIEGEINQLFNRYQVNKQIARLKNHVIVCGLGRNGREAVRELIKQEVPFMVIEHSQEVIDDFHTDKAILVLQGDAQSEDSLEKANIAQALGLISALSTDADNVFLTLTAREMNPRLKIIARAARESAIPKLRRAGADEVIIPNLIGGRKMANMLTRPALMEFIELVSGDSKVNTLHLEDIACVGQGKLLGKTLSELAIRSHTGVLVLGYKSGQSPVELNPPANRKILPEDRLFLIGTTSQLAAFREMYME